ncbi:MAG TPA: metallophosphoesterase [Planctomycetota bacterium]
MLVRSLPAGPVDVVGDVHGWLEPLRLLMRQLGYAADGSHAEGRRLVFVGDLVDRGPDSAEVARLVHALIAAGNAFAVLGNHELNLLLRRPKADNHWWFGDAARDEEIPDFFAGWPLALERADLRVVHACWDAAAIEAVRPVADVRTAWRAGRRAVAARLRARCGTGRIGALERELAEQNANPVKLLTSGPEAPSARAFKAGGKSRRTDRVRWWEAYAEPVAVVFGHYWRHRCPGDRISRQPYLFDAAAEPQFALGPTGTAWCIDYSNGHRSVDAGAVLAALRMPERTLHFV